MTCVASVSSRVALAPPFSIATFFSADFSMRKTPSFCASFARIASFKSESIRSGKFMRRESYRPLGEAQRRDSEEGVERAAAERFPDLDHLVDDDRGEAHRHPDARLFDWQIRPRADLQPDERVIAKRPPAVRERQCYFPEQADQEQQEEGESERAPIDEIARCLEEAGRRNKR